MPLAYVLVMIAAIALGWANGDQLDDDLALMPVFFLYTLVGTLIASRDRHNAIGWLLSSAGLFATVTFLVGQYALFGMVTAPGSLPAAEIAAWLSLWLWMGMLASLLYTVLLFPSGSLPSPRWRPVSVVAGVVMAIVAAVFAFGTPTTSDAVPLANPFWMPALAPVYAVVEAGFVIFVALFGAAVLSLVLRFRRARGIERQQLKWIVAAGVLMVLTLAGSLMWENEWGWLVAVAALPLSVGAAILRHRLYEIDVLINRALVYGALSASLVGTYVLSVLGLTALVRPMTGSGDLAVAGSTLAVLALFQPLRARIQRFVDRRFYRARYDAGRTIDRFGARLREQVDLDQLKGELIGVVDETIKPAHASLWLREQRS